MLQPLNTYLKRLFKKEPDHDKLRFKYGDSDGLIDLILRLGTGSRIPAPSPQETLALASTLGLTPLTSSWYQPKCVMKHV